MSDEEEVLIKELEVQLFDLIEKFEKNTSMIVDEVFVGRKYVKGQRSLLKSITVRVYAK